MLHPSLLTLSYVFTLVAISEGDDDTKRRVKRLLGYQTTCPPGCLSCTAVNGCLTCSKGMYLFLLRDGPHQSGVCLNACPDGYFSLDLPNMKRCFRCRINNCESCYSNTYCKKCTPPYSLYHGKCIMRCPPGLFYESYTHSCRLKVDCAVGDWNPWSDCTRNSQICGYKYGIQSRTRETLQNPSPGGLACPPLTEYRQCRMLHRYCADIENNHSQLVPQVYPTIRQERRRLRRRRCRQRGRVWKKGKCLKANKNRHIPRPLDVYGNTVDIVKSSKSMKSYRSLQ